MLISIGLLCFVGLFYIINNKTALLKHVKQKLTHQTEGTNSNSAPLDTTDNMQGNDAKTNEEIDELMAIPTVDTTKINESEATLQLDELLESEMEDTKIDTTIADDLTLDTEEPLVQPVPEEESATIVEETKNCSLDLTCLAESAKNCENAKAVTSYLLQVTGLDYSVTDYYEIQKTSNNTCDLYMTVTRAQVKFSEPAKAGLITQGMTEAEIDILEEEGTAELQTTYVGKKANCIFSNNSTLVNILKEWSAGDRTSTAISSVAQCSGALMNVSFGEII